MATNPDWLELLGSATQYQELQNIFNQLVAEAQAGLNPAELGRAIDEAVRRLEQERARDERELSDIKAKYDSFKEQHSGVVGWFKRHIPFTETRKQELAQRDEMADQTAEILADNLVIARAQMIKERFLYPADRQLGQRPDHWKIELQQHDSPVGLTSYAGVLKTLASESDRARAFLAELKKHVEAFSGAQFSAEEDVKRRDADLAASRGELSALEKEVDEKVALKKAGLRQVGGLAATELQHNDPAFREDGQRAERLKAVLDRLEESRTAIGKLAAAAAATGGLVKQLTALPAEIQQQKEANQRLESDRSVAMSGITMKHAVREQMRQRQDEAKRALDLSKQSLDSAKQMVDAFMAQRGTSTSMGQMVEVEPVSSPFVAKYQEAQTAHAMVQGRFQEASHSYETAKREADAAQTSVDGFEGKLRIGRDKITALEHKAPQIRHEIIGSVDRGRAAFDAASTAISLYLNTAATAGSAVTLRPEELAPGVHGWLGARGIEHPYAEALFQAERDLQRHVQAVGVLDRLSHWHDAQKKALEQERSAARERRNATWKRRCRELLGPDLADEACASGAP